MQHPDFAVLTVSWELALRADGYADNTVKAYQNAVRSLADWLAEHHPEVGSIELERRHIRGWLVEVRESHSSNTARGWFAGVRHFCRWLQSEARPTRTPPRGSGRRPRATRRRPSCRIRTCGPCSPPAPGPTSRPDGTQPSSCCSWTVGCGCRSWPASIADVDLRDRIVYVVGKASRRSGPRHRAVPLGVKAARALDRYLRERRRHPYADTPLLWLGSRGRPALAADGVDAMLKRRGADAGIADLHPHAFRHTWAHAFRAAGGNEGDLMLLGGWRSRAMLDRYGKTAAADRAADAYRRLSLGDRI